MPEQTGSRRVVAITGGTGFVGRRLADRHLALGDTVRILTRMEKPADMPRQGLLFCRGDLNGDPEVLRAFAEGADILYHCAAELRDPASMDRVNVEGTRNLAGAASKRIGRWVQLSSVAIYGRQPDGGVAEGTLPDAGRPYPTTASKLAAERIVMTCAGEGAFSCSILRPCKIYGAGMPDDALRRLTAYIGRGLFFFIGRPGASANYVHVDNVVEALMLCASRAAACNRAFNLCDGHTLEELVAAVARSLGRPMPRLRVPERTARAMARMVGGLWGGFPLSEERIDGLTSRTVYLSEAIRQELGYRPVIDLEAGVREWMGAATGPMRVDG